MMMMRTSYRLVDADKGDVRLPESNEIVPPKYPRGDAASDEARQIPPHATGIVDDLARQPVLLARRRELGVDAHVRPRARRFARQHRSGATARRKRKLLDELATYFVDSGFDLRNLWHTLASTQAYQLSSQHDDPEAAAPQLFARMLSKPLTPEQLYDSFDRTGTASVDRRHGLWFDASARPACLDEDPARTEFVRRMRPPPGSVTEYRAGTLQALMLMNGRTTTEATGHDSSSLLGALDAPFMTGEDQVESLFLAALSRRPDSEEREACAQALTKCETPEERHRAMSDMLWALVNSTEFAFNH